MLKKASVPVTMLVLLVLALYVAALFTFIFIGVRNTESVERGYDEVTRLSVKVNNENFSPRNLPEREGSLDEGFVVFWNGD